MSARQFLSELDDDGFEDAPSLGPVHARFGLLREARHRSVSTIHRLLAHATTMCELYGEAKRDNAIDLELKQLYCQHLAEQFRLVAALLERARTLGCDLSPAPCRTAGPALRRCFDRTDTFGRLEHVLGALELGQIDYEAMWRQANLDCDRATYDLLVDEIVRTNERQSWHLAEQVLRVRRSMRGCNVAPLSASGAHL